MRVIALKPDAPRGWRGWIGQSGIAADVGRIGRCTGQPDRRAFVAAQVRRRWQFRHTRCMRRRTVWNAAERLSIPCLHQPEQRSRSFEVRGCEKITRSVLRTVINFSSIVVDDCRLEALMSNFFYVLHGKE